MRVSSTGLAQDRSRIPMIVRKPRAKRGARCSMPLQTAAFLAGLAVAPLALPGQGGGNGTFYVGTYAKNILVLDEATMKVRDSIKTGAIPYAMTLSFNRQHFYVLNPYVDSVETIDIPTRKSLGTWSLSHDTIRVRMTGFNVDPLEHYAFMVIKSTIKKKDRFEVGRPTLVRYDLTKKAKLDTIPWPNGQEREGAQVIFAPKGDLMYFFTNEDVRSEE